MRILHVIDQISQKTAGGSAKVCFQMAQSQSKLGHDVTIYTTDYNAKGQETPQGVKMVKFHCWLNLLGGMRIAPGFLWAEYRKFDVIHLHNYRTFVNLIASDTNYPRDPEWIPRWMRSRHIPIVLQADGSAAPLAKKHWTQRVWKDGIMGHIDACICDAPVEVSHYKTEGFNGVMAGIPVGIDLADFKDLPKRQMLNRFNVLYLGRLHPIKGIDLLIEAVSQLPDVHLTIAGNDENGYEYDLKNQVVRLGMAQRVDFVGPLYGKDKLQAYVNSDLYAMTSRYEMWGLTYLEAMACGVPVLMTNQSEMSQVLPSKCGIVTEPDVSSIEFGIKYAQRQGIRDLFQEERKAWVSQYDWSVITPRIIKLYEELRR